MTKAVLIETERNVATLTLNRPEAFNALSYELADELGLAATALARDDSAKVVIVTGAGKAFCAGGDLRWASEFEGSRDQALHTLAGRFHYAALEIKRMKKPVIAAINGVAAGGGFSLALACDFRVMAGSARLVQAYTSAGLSIDGGGTWSLPRIVGLAKALEIAAFDEPITAEQALGLGLVTRLAEDGGALDAAKAMAQTLMKRSLHSFGQSKRLLAESFESGFEAQLEREREAIADCSAHSDGLEGVAAFLEKRKPEFNK